MADVVYHFWLYARLLPSAIYIILFTPIAYFVTWYTWYTCDLQEHITSKLFIYVICLNNTASGLSSRCPDIVLPLDPPRSGWVSKVDSARIALTIIQFTAHVIFISNTNSQQAHICKSYNSPVAIGERRRSHNQHQTDWGSISASTWKALQGAYHHSERSTIASGRQVRLPWKHIV